MGRNLFRAVLFAVRSGFPVAPLVLLALPYGGMAAGIASYHFNSVQVRNIPPAEYMGDVQVWDMDTDGGQVVFAATADGLSVFDGVRWSAPADNIPLKRVVFDPSDGRLYAAGDDGFGFFSRNDRGEYRYRAIFSSASHDGGDIFADIVLTPDAGYFRTEDNIYKYDKSSHEVSLFFEGHMLRLFRRDDKTLYIQSNHQLIEVTEGKPAATDIFIPTGIIDIFHYEDSLLLVTEEKGLVFLNRKGERWEYDNTSNQMFVKTRLSSVCADRNGNLLLGSIVDGLFVLDGGLEVTAHYNAASGLKHTTVLCALESPNGDIWLGLDGGMAVIGDSSPYYTVMNRSGDMGSVHDAAWYDGKLYVATNKGLYFYRNDGVFEFVAGSQGAIRQLVAHENVMVACHDAGALVLTSDVLSPRRYGAIRQLTPYIPSRNLWLSVDADGGFSVYALRNGEFLPERKAGNYGERHYGAIVDRYGKVWTRDRLGNVVKITLDRDHNVAGAHKYEFPFPGPVRMAVIDGDAVFYSDSLAYTYDISSDAMRVNDYYGALFSRMRFFPLSVTQVKDDFFYVSRTEAGVVRRVGNGFYDFGRLAGFACGETPPVSARRVIPFDARTVALGTQNGVVFFDCGASEREGPLLPVVEKITATTDSGTQLLPLEGRSGEYEAGQNDARIRIYLSNLYSHRQVEWSLNGGGWRSADAFPYLDAGRLPAGLNIITVRNLASRPEGECDMLTLRLRVRYPWYMSWRFFMLVLLSLLAVAVAVGSLFRREMRRLRDILLRKHRWSLEKEQKEHEIELLTTRLREGEKKLMNVTMSGVERNAILTELKTRVKKIPVADSPAVAAKVRDVLRNIERYLNDKENSEMFEHYFNAIYDGFLDRLMQRHPTITSGEMKLAAYIKLNLSTKEIATYMNISPSSVEIARHRLRRKMDLPSGTKLQNYISEI